jgi:glycylpeptide N-tetradecanoyltransferase
MIRRDAVPSSPSLSGLRELREADVPEVAALLRAYLGRFDLAPNWTDEEVRHTFWSVQGKVTWTYVVEDPATHRITDFFSFYSLPSTALRTNPPSTLNAAYLFYYATTACPACAHLARPGGTSEPGEAKSWEQESHTEKVRLGKRLVELMGDALTMAKKVEIYSGIFPWPSQSDCVARSQENFDVFNALTLMDNSLFIKELKVCFAGAFFSFTRTLRPLQQFGAGDGFLHWYLYNWAVRPISGGEAGSGGSGVGMVML